MLCLLLLLLVCTYLFFISEAPFCYVMVTYLIAFQHVTELFVQTLE